MGRQVKAWIGIGMLVSLLVGWGVVQGAEKPDATLRLSEGSAALGIGWSWGKGVLTYKGKTYPVKIEGLSVGEVGVTKAEARGDVFNLKRLEDFSGLYAAAGAEGTAVKGAGVTGLRNQHGVSIELKSATKGANLKLAAEGLKLTLDNK
jgi:hypothetical protein